MQYTIDTQGFVPNAEEVASIDAKIGLSLFRFTHMITRCELAFDKQMLRSGNHFVSCKVSIYLVTSSTFVVTDTGANINEALPLALERVKRNIQMHIKRGKVQRMAPALSSRLN